MIQPICKQVRQMSNAELMQTINMKLSKDMWGDFMHQVSLEIKRRKLSK